MGAGVETQMRAAATARAASQQAGPSGDTWRGVQVQLLGPLVIKRDGVAQPLPPSRKVRALFGYLALAPRAVGRSHLCELLWDVPNDPRAELRWCLSKIRSVLDGPDRRRVEASGDSITLDLNDCSVDAIEIARATQQGIATLEPESAASAFNLVRRRFSGWARDRSQSAVQWLAHRAAAPLSRVPRRRARASRPNPTAGIRRSVQPSGDVARTGSFRSGRAWKPSARAHPTRPNPRGRRTPGGNRAALRGRRTGPHTDSSAVARRQSGTRESAAIVRSERGNAGDRRGGQNRGHCAPRIDCRDAVRRS